MIKIINWFKKYGLLLFFGLVLAICLLPYYTDGKIIAGGEGSYFLDFIQIVKNYGSSWVNSGTGMLAINISFPFVFYLNVLQIFIQNERIINFISIYAIYFLPFFIVYLLSLELKVKSLFAFLISLFYILNPFTIIYLNSINPWNMLAAYILPAFFFIIYKFYDKNWELFFFFGLHSLFFAFTNANPPLMALFQISIIIFVVFVSFLKEKRINILIIFNKYILIIGSFVLFNLWWIINWIYIFFEVQTGYTKEFAISWLRASGQFTPSFYKTFTLTNLLGYPIGPKNGHYSYFFTPVILALPVFIIILYLIKTKMKNNKIIVLGLLLCLVGFFAKGVDGLFGIVYEYLVMNLPLFKIFKSAGEKWGVLFIFILTLSLIFIFQTYKKEKFYNILLFLLIVYTSYSSVPFFTANFIPDYRHGEMLTGSRKFFDKSQYQNLRKELTSDPEEYRVLSLPGSANYQVALNIDGEKYYTGNDPVLNNTNKAFIAPYNGSFSQRFNFLFEKISDPDYLNLLPLFNIGKIVINKDSYPWFGFLEKESTGKIEKILDKNLLSEKNKTVDLYDINQKYYLPKIYIPKSITYSPASTLDDLINLVSFHKPEEKNAYFVNPDISKKSAVSNSALQNISEETIIMGEIQSLVDEAKLKAGTIGINPGGVNFPYAKWKPGTLYYPIVLQKEEQIKKEVSGNSLNSFKTHLFYASKRIYEIQKWGKDLSFDNYSLVLEKYLKEMENAISDMDKYTKDNAEIYPLVIEIEVTFNAQTERLNDLLKGFYGDHKNERTILSNKIINRINESLKIFLKAHYLPTKYKFTIPEDGEYEIFAENKNISSDWKIEDKLSRKDYQFSLKPQSISSKSNWISYGEKKFKTGKTFLQFNKSQPVNLFSDKWSRIENNVEIDKDIKLTGSGIYPGIFQNIGKWQPETYYRLSLKYKTKNGPLKILVVEDNEVINDPTRFEKIEKNHLAFADKLESEDKWRDYSVGITSGRYAKSAKISIFNESKPAKEIDSYLKDILIESISDPRIALRKINNYDGKKIPDIIFKKINLTRYEISVINADKPYLLVFSESFHRGWKVYIDKYQPVKGNIVFSDLNNEIIEKKDPDTFIDKNIFNSWTLNPLPENQHVLINGYANSWIINPQDAGNKENYQITIEYFPQRLFYLGILISLLTLIITVAIGLKLYLLKNK